MRMRMQMQNEIEWIFGIKLTRGNDNNNNTIHSSQHCIIIKIIMSLEYRFIIQHSIDCAASVNINDVLSLIENRFVQAKSTISWNFTLASDIKRIGDGSNTKFILTVWPYILVVEIRKERRDIHISLGNECEGVSNYELCQYLIQNCREIAGDIR